MDWKLHLLHIRGREIRSGVNENVTLDNETYKGRSLHWIMGLKREAVIVNEKTREKFKVEEVKREKERAGCDSLGT